MAQDAKSVVTKKAVGLKFYDASFVNEYGKIESLRAQRYNSNFSLVLMNLESSDKRTTDNDTVDLIKKMSGAVLDSMRTCDVVGLIEDRQVAAILPETDYFGSLIAIRKLSKTINACIAKENMPYTAVLSQATFPKDGKGYGALLSTASKRMQDKKDSIWEKREFKDKLFWEIIADITTSSIVGFDNSTYEAGGGNQLDEHFIDQVNDLILKEVMQSPFKRGILYVVSKKINGSNPVVNSLSHVGSLSTKVFLVGQVEDNLRDIKNASPLFLDDPRLRESFFTFYLTEESGYAMICKENWGSTFSCFHTADKYLVDGLIHKFQIEYVLQEQL